MPKAFTNHHHCYSSLFYSLTTARSPSLSLDDQQKFSPYLVYSYDNALHGFSASLSLDELEELKKSLWFISSDMDSTATLTPLTPTKSYLSTLLKVYGLLPTMMKTSLSGLDSGDWPKSENFQDHGITSQIPSKWKGKCDVGQDFNSFLCNSKLLGVKTFQRGTLTVAASTTARSFGGILTFGDNFTIIGWTMFRANAMVEKAPLYDNKTISRCNSAKNLSREVTHPCVYISQKEALAGINYARSTEIPFVSMKLQQTITGTRPAPPVAFYSSRGPSPSFPGILKPDIMAPGRQLYRAGNLDESAQIGSRTMRTSGLNH
ncbi:hypothetical protein FEM48_Zijuj02G0181800 [Ziziphus jujuba var. spinosa]|uniref:Inhibitor I9 domain-containing protein n=1 Tax=Ziziphus jujuba var. spinosa TaxID=714518 RepID=A0A978VX73_ZIZJJ|nr:hypothetical protein FEM48_Zijuj02G0181800 [Ziziphus jujuba var. spinosa]